MKLAMLLLASLVCAWGPVRGGEPAAAGSAVEAEEIARAAALVDAMQWNALEEARGLLDAVLAANPESAAAHREYARIHIRAAFSGGERHDPQGLEKAEQALDRAIALSPRFAEAHVLRGHVYRHQGRYAQAHADLATHGNYAWFLLCRRGRPQEAIGHAREALQLAGDSPTALILLSSALYADWSQQFRSGDADADADAWTQALDEAALGPIQAMEFSCGGSRTLDLMRALRDSGRVPGVPAMFAMLAAAEAGEDKVPGIFEFTVAGSGSDEHGTVFLNSEEDYRDQRALTVRLPRQVADAWRELHREDPQALKGRRISVLGYVTRVRIDFTAGGLASGKYYYQTHLTVWDLDQIMVGVSPPPSPAPLRARRERI